MDLRDVLAGVGFGSIFLGTLGLLHLGMAWWDRRHPEPELEPWELFLERIVEGESR